MVVHQAAFGMAESLRPLARNLRPIRTGIFVVAGRVADYQVVASGTKVRLCLWSLVDLASPGGPLVKSVVQEDLQVPGVLWIQECQQLTGARNAEWNIIDANQAASQKRLRPLVT